MMPRECCGYFWLGIGIDSRGPTTVATRIIELCSYYVLPAYGGLMLSPKRTNLLHLYAKRRYEVKKEEDE